MEAFSMFSILVALNVLVWGCVVVLGFMGWQLIRDFLDL